ncbi:MAG: hypothetical protein B7Y39_02805 [Bdellovibrio sp. 28-41-41]|nr:MAG: hypothetical protein B7Y39_02805 [Bdellovibrio sp. 28-41-41]
MNFIIKMVLSSILFVQFGFAETVLFYQKPKVKNAIDFMGTQPTVDEVSKMIAFGKMDAQSLITIRKFLKEKKIAGTTRMPGVELKGNRLTIEGLKFPLVIGNSEKLQISYDGENVELKNPNDVAQTFKDVEAFFGQKVGKHDAIKYLLFRLGAGERAEAVLFLPYLIALAVLALAGGIYSWWNSKNKKGLEEWPFEVDNFGKPVVIKCEAGNLSVMCGNEKMTFRVDSSGSAATDYVDMKKPSRTGTLVSTGDDGLMRSSGRFSNAFYSQQKKETVMSMAKVILGENGQRKICTENEFAENLGPVYAEIAKQVTDHSKKKDKPQAIQKLKSLDSGNQAK